MRFRRPYLQLTKFRPPPTLLIPVISARYSFTWRGNGSSLRPATALPLGCWPSPLSRLINKDWWDISRGTSWMRFSLGTTRPNGLAVEATRPVQHGSPSIRDDRTAPAASSVWGQELSLKSDWNLPPASSIVSIVFSRSRVDRARQSTLTMIVSPGRN